MAGDYRAPPRPKNVFDHPKLKLSAPCPTPAGKGKWSSLGWQVVGNNPRMVIYTNDPDDTGEQNDYGKINANMDTLAFFSFIELLGMVIALPTPTGESVKFAVDNKQKGWDRNTNRPGEAYTVSTTWIGKDTDGTIWISIRSKKKERPVIKFPFKMPDFHDLRNGDGTQWTDGQKSELAAKGYLRMMELIMPVYLATNYVEPEKKDQNGGGGNNGGNRGGGSNYNNNGSGNSDRSGGGGSSGGSSSSSNDNDDDIPF